MWITKEMSEEELSVLHSLKKDKYLQDKFAVLLVQRFCDGEFKNTLDKKYEDLYNAKEDVCSSIFIINNILKNYIGGYDSFLYFNKSNNVVYFDYNYNYKKANCISFTGIGHVDIFELLRDEDEGKKEEQ
jgi:hypothetical protein